MAEAFMDCGTHSSKMFIKTEVSGCRGVSVGRDICGELALNEWLFYRLSVIKRLILHFKYSITTCELNSLKGKIYKT